MMKKLILCMLLLLPLALFAQQNAAYVKYINQYKKIALAQEKAHKIPACITLAQGLLESGAGTSRLAVEGNNHFGIKCHSDWTGETMHHDDDQAGECFRKYKKAEESFEDHSLFLMRTRYASLFELEITDYKGWAHGLKRCGYATDPGYASKLIKIIEDYELMNISSASLSAGSATVETVDLESNVTSDDKTIQTEEKVATKKDKKEKKDNPLHKKKTTTKKSDSSDKNQTVNGSVSTGDKSASTLAEDSVNTTVSGTPTTTVRANESEENAAHVGGVKKSNMGKVELFSEHKVYKDKLVRWVKAEAGDTYEMIAEEFNIEVSRLRNYNNASKNDTLTAGQRVYLTKKH